MIISGSNALVGYPAGGEFTKPLRLIQHREEKPSLGTKALVSSSRLPLVRVEGTYEIESASEEQAIFCRWARVTI